MGRTGSGRELSVGREYEKWRGREYGDERERASPGAAGKRACAAAPRPVAGVDAPRAGRGGTRARMGEGRLGP